MGTRVRFIECEGKLSVLEVESSPEHPLVRRLVATLAELGVRVVHREELNMPDRSVQRVSVAELDGGTITEASRLKIQAALITSASQPPAAD